MLCYNSNSSFKWTHVYKVSLFKNKGEILRPVAYFFNIIDKQMYTVLFSYHHILVPDKNESGVQGVAVFSF